MPAERSPWTAERTRAIVATHRDKRGPLLPILHALQEEFGYVDSAAIPVVADALNIAKAEVYGVVTFYKDFRTDPPARLRVSVCRAEACQAAGADRLATFARLRLNVDFGQTSADGSVELDEVFCLGNCALGPSVAIGGRLVGRVDEKRFEEILAEAGTGRV